MNGTGGAVAVDGLHVTTAKTLDVMGLPRPQRILREPNVFLRLVQRIHCIHMKFIIDHGFLRLYSQTM